MLTIEEALKNPNGIAGLIVPTPSETQTDLLREILETLKTILYEMPRTKDGWR